MARQLERRRRNPRDGLARLRRATGGERRQLAAVAGGLRRTVEGAHIDPGTIDFFVLRPKGDGFDVTSELTGERFGSGGQPGTVNVIRAGSDFYGFRVEDGWFGQASRCSRSR
jgi:hypothetical protein